MEADDSRNRSGCSNARSTRTICPPRDPLTPNLPTPTVSWSTYFGLFNYRERSVEAANRVARPWSSKMDEYLSVLIRHPIIVHLKLPARSCDTGCASSPSPSPRLRCRDQHRRSIAFRCRIIGNAVSPTATVIVAPAREGTAADRTPLARRDGRAVRQGSGKARLTAYRPCEHSFGLLCIFDDRDCHPQAPGTASAHNLGRVEEVARHRPARRFRYWQRS